MLLFRPTLLTAMIGTQTTPSSGTESSPAASSAATPASETTATSEATATPTAAPSTTAKATPSATNPAAAEALNACRDRVEAADKVLKEAKTGIGHWEAHVDAERRQEAGTISIARRQEIFKETRLKGPGDQKRYADALRAYEKVRDASCGKVTGAEAKVAATLARCHDRATAQSQVMKTAAAAMGDWKQHLADMQRSRTVHNSNAQQVWLNAYKAAPRNIKPYEKAVRTFDKAPDC